ncbi:hypothetical protein QBC39DRAFT_287347 [Podospora conica]|nr:hypothetical protein QBC39DRAFT_287347 [Schizothecium conicum]
MTDPSKADQKESESSQQEQWTTIPPPPPYEPEQTPINPTLTQPDAHAPSSSMNGMKLPAPFSLSRPFPPTMNAYYIYDLSNLAGTLKTFKICNGNAKTDVVFTAEMHTGLLPRPPLGTRPGILLHQGASHKGNEATVIAAAGGESLTSEGYLHFHPRSVVILPPLCPGGGTPRRVEKSAVQMATEVMSAVRLEGPGEQVGFDVSMDGVYPGREGQRRRVAFQWRKKEDGFEMVRLGGSVPGGSGEDGEGKEGVEDEVVASLKWPSHAVGWFVKMFSLELKGSARSGALGERCVLMILVTACRIWMLKFGGKTTKSFVKVAEKTHGKEARVGEK